MILCDAQNDVLTGLKPLEPARQLNHAAPPEFTPATQPAAVDIETPRCSSQAEEEREGERGEEATQICHKNDDTSKHKTLNWYQRLIQTGA